MEYCDDDREYIRPSRVTMSAPLSPIPHLPFGKYKGHPLYRVPAEYLVWLAGFDNSLVRLASSVFRCDCAKCEQFYTNSNSETEEDVYNSIRNCFNDGVLPICIHEEDQSWWWIYMSHRDWIYKAREEFKSLGICRACFKRLVPIGTCRQNGKEHDDWEGRTLHKQCWKGR